MKRIIAIGLLLLCALSCKNENEVKKETYKYPFLNPELKADERAADIVGRLTIEEKIFQLFNNAPAIERLGIPEYNWWNECLHGVARAGKATVFPQAIGLASTFNEELMYELASVASDEARAKHHYFVKNGVRSNYTGLTFWSPNINIFRDPRWGRGQETYGEDPYLTGRMAVIFINGLQGDHPRYFKTIATAKHYAVHNGPEPTRHTDNFYVNDRDLNETYLPAFKMAVKEANVQSVMCAYNRFRDKPCCGSDLLLQRKLREEFGFEGYVVTDCGATRDFWKKEYHNVVETPAQALGWALASGTDLNCEQNEPFTSDNILEAIEMGMVNEADINRALKRLFKARIQLGMFDPPSMVPYTNIPIEKVGSNEHLSIAKEAAKQSLVLLKNDGILPLKENTKIALIGANSHNLDVLLGNYNGLPINPITPWDGLVKRVGKENVTYALGSPLVPGFYGNMSVVPATTLFHKTENGLQPGLKARYFKGLGTNGTSVLERIDKNIDFLWEQSPISGLVEESFSVEWTGAIKPEVSGEYQLRVEHLYGKPKIYINNKEVKEGFTKLTEGKPYEFKVTYQLGPKWYGTMASPFAHLQWVRRDFDYELEAFTNAENADVIVYCGGISPRLEGEEGEVGVELEGFSGGDRKHLKLPAIQEKQLKKLHALGKPIIYVNFSGSAIALNWQNENLPAIIQAFYPGEATGDALAELLLGDYSPSGKLPVTFYKSVEDLPDFKDYRMQGRTYRYYDGEVLYPFGHGLSYTQFEYTDLKASNAEAGNKVEVNVKVKNMGDMDAYETVQLYISDQVASTPVPIRTLVGIEKVFLKKGETTTIKFKINPEQMSVIDDDYERVVEPGDFRLTINGWGKESPSTLLTLTGEVKKLHEQI
ncbi:glycoside hydrolase family 3 C-terminal domain-containing protein [Seonamhaeicola sp.]|uniref:glycoside hydrolase family 3 C-terminal domain-containing protein n=1 Tax=Seonamhaeicola sp. TaxID=1912245 RepID=UPI002617FAE2|nr:glycoside hydrolase family 3 C-terminal domain-containing protein [Seonamhaeicola sp.]